MCPQRFASSCSAGSAGRHWRRGGPLRAVRRMPARRSEGPSSPVAILRADGRSTDGWAFFLRPVPGVCPHNLVAGARCCFRLHATWDVLVRRQSMPMLWVGLDGRASTEGMVAFRLQRADAILARFRLALR